MMMKLCYPRGETRAARNALLGGGAVILGLMGAATYTALNEQNPPQPAAPQVKGRAVPAGPLRPIMPLPSIQPAPKPSEERADEKALIKAMEDAGKISAIGHDYDAFYTHLLVELLHKDEKKFNEIKQNDKSFNYTNWMTAFTTKESLKFIKGKENFLGKDYIDNIIKLSQDNIASKEPLAVFAMSYIDGVQVLPPSPEKFKELIITLGGDNVDKNHQRLQDNLDKMKAAEPQLRKAWEIIATELPKWKKQHTEKAAAPAR